MGAYVTKLYGIDSGDGTFKAVFWMWSVCPEQTDEPLMTLEFPNGEDISADLEDKLERDDGWWSTRKFIGTFRNTFELKDFPFDRQQLTIQVEEAVLDDRELLYTADSDESGLSPAVSVPGWELDKLTAAASVYTYPTTFGDPSLPDGSSRYARLTVSIPAERAHWATFAQATFSLYIVALLVFAGMLFNIVSESMFLGRMGVLGSALFAVVVGYSTTDNLIGARGGMYLLDYLYLTLLLLIVASTAWTIAAHRWVATALSPDAMLRQDRLVSAGLAGSYLLANLVLLVMAQT
ncbi:hypothetical protein [Brevundimonas sp.]|uniref:hypothetical protein n=1 Tax=Brevundimonas sp. TaxID=1871086 RepID=UPI002612A475|nr:hypothetical protein [Brevundimonas sp.]